MVLGDWGIRRLRLFLMQGPVIHDQREGPGIDSLCIPPVDALMAALSPWVVHKKLERIILCGMVGSRNGLLEAPYLHTPVSLGEWTGHLRYVKSHGLDIAISPGLRGINESCAPDVMRGEETQIFGAIRLEPGLAVGTQLLVLPGTHCKWVHLQDGVVAGFTTHITGELLDILRNHSTLLRAGGAQDRSERGFASGLDRGRRSASGLTAALFEARTAQLIEGRTQGWAADFLSGLLIAYEVREALKNAIDIRGVTIVGDPRLTSLYCRALAPYKIGVTELDGNRCAVSGLRLLATASHPDPFQAH